MKPLPKSATLSRLVLPLTSLAIFGASYAMPPITLTNDSNTREIQAQKSIQMSCGNFQQIIACGHKTPFDNSTPIRFCNSNKLIFKNVRTGATQLSPTPEASKHVFVEEKTPISLACASGNNGKYYVLVGYSACSKDANYSACEHHDLFTASGVRFTSNAKLLDSLIAEHRLNFASTVTIEQ